MMLPDVNVLIGAFRSDAGHHHECRGWLNRLIESGASFAMSPLALGAVVRITTQARVFVVPSTLDEAFGYCDDILGQPGCRVVEPGEAHWGIFKRLAMQTGTRGSRLTDVWFAALAIEWGCEWVTLDRDFARFPGLRWKAPDAE